MHRDLNEVQPGWQVIDQQGEKIGDVHRGPSTTTWC